MPFLSGDARQAVFAPLDDGAQRSEAVIRRLGSAIALGLLEDGEQLPSESGLATLLGVSTNTLRDALADLRALGLVETRRGRAGGSFVRALPEALAGLSRGRVEELGTTDLRELGELHEALAGSAAAHAASRASAAELARLDDLIARLERESETEVRRRTESRFYIELAASAQSVRLTREVIQLQIELGQLPWPPANSPALIAQTIASHRALIAALRSRDTVAARSLAEMHIATRTRWLLDVHHQFLTQSRTDAM